LILPEGVLLFHALHHFPGETTRGVITRKLPT
jgi:hypothetical protein